MLMGEVRAEGLLRAIDPAVRVSLTEAQEDAIRAAARRDSWKRHPVDIRLALPTPFGRFYLALIGGREHRSAAPARRRTQPPSPGERRQPGDSGRPDRFARSGRFGALRDFRRRHPSVTRAGAAWPASVNAG